VSTRVRLLGLRYDERSSHLRGAAEAPPRIREALFSGASNLWAEDGTDLDGRFDDRGDVEPGTGDAALAAITAAARGVVDGPALFLGGDHSITFPVMRAVAERHGPVSILHFDAHPDLYDQYQGDPFSHACPFARVLEAGFARRLVQVGIRTLNGHQREQARRFGVEIVPVAEWDRYVPDLTGPCYVSFDLDGLDPAFAPGVSHREPGGLSVRQALRVIQALRGPVVAADLVELNPGQDPSGASAVVCAKLIKELAARLLATLPPA
jgi:agmatinase